MSRTNDSDSSDLTLFWPDITLAPKPFNRKDSDIIFRTADNVDFYVHKPVVRIASPVLDDLVTKASVSQISMLEGRPVVQVPENNTVLNALLRFCYPTPRPTFSTLPEIRDVLCSANDYELRFVIDALREPLLSYAEELPVQVYCIACRNNMEECARTAAEYAVRGPFWETYVPEIEFITAGAYWKLLAYYWDNNKAKRRPKLRKSPKLHWRTQDLQLSVPSTKPPSPLTSTATFPFDNASDGDIILLSADGVQFRAHKIILAMSSGFFKDMFNIPQGSAKPSTSTSESLACVIPFTESSETLDSLLRTIYPVDEPDVKLVQDIKSVLEAAIKYDITKGISMMKKKLIACGCSCFSLFGPCANYVR
jgi:BTB/POZ domain